MRDGVYYALYRPTNVGVEIVRHGGKWFTRLGCGIPSLWRCGYIHGARARGIDSGFRINPHVTIGFR